MKSITEAAALTTTAASCELAHTTLDLVAEAIDKTSESRVLAHTKGPGHGRRKNAPVLLRQGTGPKGEWTYRA